MSNLNEIKFNNKVCRTCLSPSEDLQSLYATDSGLAEMLMSLTPIKVSVEDGLPTQICCICITELHQFHTFQLKCLESDNILRNRNMEKTSTFEEVIIKKELPIYTDSINAFDPSCATPKSLEDPLQISDVKLEKDDVNILNAAVPFLPRTRVKSVVEMYKCAIGEKPYACTECGSVYADEKSLATHKLTHVTDKPYPCTKCTKSYTRKTSLLRHMQSHPEIDTNCAPASLQDPLTPAQIKNDLNQELDIKHEIIDVKIENKDDSLGNQTCDSEKPYACTICDRAFKSKRYLNCHLETHSGKKPYKCTVCNNSFTRKLSLRYHMLIHTGEKPYACSFCDKSFALKGQLTVHLRNHTGEKPYTCTICNTSFHQKCTLTKHLRTHTGGKKKYRCRYCDRLFESWHLLNEHLITHAGEKIYPCDECSKLFTTKSYLKSHMLIHTGEKQYACAFCVKSFTQKSQLAVHLRTHTGERPYTCTICNHSFKHTGTLTTHLQLHSKYSCTFCEKSFARSYLLKVHLRTHTGA